MTNKYNPRAVEHYLGPRGLHTMRMMFGKWECPDVIEEGCAQVELAISLADLTQTWAHPQVKDVTEKRSSKIEKKLSPDTKQYKGYVNARLIEMGGLDSKVEAEMNFPIHWLVHPLLPYSLYHFSFSGFDDKVDSRTQALFRNGYFGVTKRPPLSRIREHCRQMLQGNGHNFHNAWKWASDGYTELSVQIEIIARSGTLEEIYKLEESAVQNYSLNPKGLNMIPGGTSGIKELWRLGVLGQRSHVAIDDRDAAVSKLTLNRTGVRTHYRRGHTRQLPAGWKSETTWVNPCIVGIQPNSLSPMS